MKLRWFLFLIPALAAGADRKAEVDAILAPLLAAGKLKSASIAIREDGAAQYFAYGDPKTDRHSVFEIGSISKVFTGILLAEAVERKEAALEDPVRKLLPATGAPDPRPNEQEIRLVDLATHTSGLPRMPNNLRPRNLANPYADYDGDKLLAWIGKNGLVRNPDSQYNYSNLGAGMLGFALAWRADLTYEQLLLERICGPLKLNETRIRLTPELAARLLPGHDAKGTPVANWDLDALAGAGAIRSTAADLMRFLEANLMPAGPLAPALLLAQKPQVKTERPAGAVALGWHIKPNGVYWHNGGTGGYSSYASFDPKRGTAVVVLLNVAGEWMNQIGVRLERLLAGEPVPAIEVR
jgi:CubicO group peptidase (beta-lactamase class C family)